MRRSILTFALSLLSLTLVPATAQANFWKWLDDLSGPQFAGVSLDVRFWCGTQGDAERRTMLTTLVQRLAAAKLLYERAAQAASPPQKAYYEIAAHAADKALGFAQLAADEQSDKEKIDGLVVEALAWRAIAIENARWAERLTTSGNDDPLRRPDAAPTQLKVTGGEKLTAAGTPLIGGSASVCKFRPLDLNRTFLSANVGYGWDTKPENKGDGNKMLTLGVSAHWVAGPAVTLGAGVGRAWFWSRPSDDSFQKWYVQPLILDVKPLSIGQDPRFRNFWWHSFYVRYSVIGFPGGFEAKRFGGDSVEYPTEFVQSIGLHFDAEPLFRKWRKKWW